MAGTYPPLAIKGGPRHCLVTPVWPPPDEEVLQILQRAFVDGSWGSYQGRYCQQLSASLMQWLPSKFVFLCCSGTVAVELALRGIGIGPSDEVILAGYDFPGNFRAIEAVGARPVLVDVDPSNWNLDVGQVAAAISPATKAVVVSHLHGGLVSMPGLVELARQHNLLILEDACQAPGATIQGRHAGTWGDVGVLSFGGSKLLTAGRGGAVVTDREDIYQRIRLFSERGNQVFPLSELQAAVLLPQLQMLAQRNAQRAQSAGSLARAIADVRLLRPLANATSGEPAYYKWGLRYHPEHATAGRAEFIAAARAEGVPLDAGFRGFAMRSARRCRIVGDLAQSRLAAERMLVLHHPILLQPPEVISTLAEALLKLAWHFDLRTPA